MVMINMNFTTSSCNIYVPFWKCLDCKHVEESMCGECGNKKYKCTKMSVIVKEDFFCKDWESKNIIRYNLDYIIPDELLVDPYIPTRTYTVPTTNNSTKCKKTTHWNSSGD